MSAHQEIAAGERFAFGQNWQKYSELIDDGAIAAAKADLCEKLGTESLEGKRFLDAGSGSGLHSLAAYKLGAQVLSFDFDPDAVECTTRVRDQFAPEAGERWTIQQGSVLDQDFLAALPRADVVYSWGVLHHTGSMWEAIDNVASIVPPGGKLFISIYNDQGFPSRNWTRVKRAYNKSGTTGKNLVLAGTATYWRAKSLAGRTAGALLNGRTARKKYTPERGMDFRRDLVDWVGGWPFEVASAGEVFTFLHNRGLVLDAMKTVVNGHGCNVYVFSRPPS